MTSSPVVFILLLGLAQNAVSQYGVSSAAASAGTIYAQVPTIELPPVEAVTEPPVITILNGNGDAVSTEEVITADGRRFTLFRSNGNGYAAPQPAAAPAAVVSNGYGAPAASNGARSNVQFFPRRAGNRGFLRSNGNGYAAAAPPTPAPITNGYGAPVTTDGNGRRGFFRSNGLAAVASNGRRNHAFFRSSNGGRSGSYAAGNGSPVMAPASFIPSELAEGVSIPQIPGVAGVDYPILSQALVSSFNCQDKAAPGYYADVDSKCQVFYICQPNVDRYSFLCPNGTMFNEKYSVCDWWYNVRCEKPAPAANGYGYQSTPAPIQQSYYSMQPIAAPETDVEVTEEAVIESEPVVEDAAAAEVETLRRFNSFRSNRLRSKSSLRFRSNRLRSNGASYAQPEEEIVLPEVVNEAAAPLTNSYNDQPAASNGGRRFGNRFRSNRLRFNVLRNEATGEVHYGATTAAVQSGYGTVAPATPASIDVTVAPVVVETATLSGEEQPVVVLMNGSGDATSEEEKPVVVVMNVGEEPAAAPVAADAAEAVNGAPPTNGAGSTNAGVVSAVVDGNGDVRFLRSGRRNTRLRSLVRNFVRPRQLFRSGLLRMAAPELAGTRYDPSMDTAALNADDVTANENPVFFRARF